MAGCNDIDVSVVSITYNGLDDTLRMIRSLKEVVHSVSYEIIVVDNASRENEAEAVKVLFDDVTVIRSERNLGFSGGNNLGIARARGRYVLLLNNDTYLEQDGLGAMAAMMDADPEIGAVSPKIKFAAPPQLLQFAGFTPLSAVTMRNSIVGYCEKDCGQWDTPREIPYAHGAAMMVRREAVDKAGMMPDVYFLYYEELDWSISIRQAGYTIWYQPDCTVFHNDGQTSGVSPLRVYYLARNRMLLAWRKNKGAGRLASVVYQMGVAMPKSVAVHLSKGDVKAAGAAVRACAGFVGIKNKCGPGPDKGK